MEIFEKKLIAEPQIGSSGTISVSGYVLDNSKLNKLGNLRLSPLKSFAILFFIIAILLPKAQYIIPDISLYLGSFSAAKELSESADPVVSEKDIASDVVEQKEEMPSVKKKQTLADIWPEEFNGGANMPNVIPSVQAVSLAVNTVQPKKQTIASIWSVAENKTGGPNRLVIPSIKVSSSIENLGIGKNGAMEAPKSYLNAGWFNLGPRPGESGIAVIAGHLDSQYGAPGVFWHLSKLKAGDDIYITDGTGKNLHFKVSGSKIYGADASSGEIFEKGGNARLNLITCNGVWDKKTQNYTKRLVVSADLVAE